MELTFFLKGNFHSFIKVQQRRANEAQDDFTMLMWGLGRAGNEAVGAWFLSRPE